MKARYIYIFLVPVIFLFGFFIAGVNNFFTNEKTLIWGSIIITVLLCGILWRLIFFPPSPVYEERKELIIRDFQKHYEGVYKTGDRIRFGTWARLVFYLGFGPIIGGVILAYAVTYWFYYPTLWFSKEYEIKSICEYSTTTRRGRIQNKFRIAGTNETYLLNGYRRLCPDTHDEEYVNKWAFLLRKREWTFGSIVDNPRLLK